MNWEKKGHIFCPKGQFGFINSHAQVPTILVKEDRIRVYFATRPKTGLSVTTFVDLDKNDFSNQLYLNPKPILNLGNPGTFDEHGIMPSSVVEKNGLIYLYYSGWQRGVTVPYNNYTGLAISEDGGETFKKWSEAPILDRNLNELFSATSPCVIEEDGKWKMWYCSGTNWHKINGKFEHTYNIKYAESDNGKRWEQTGIVAIQQNNEYEAITKPALIKIEGVYHMWYCYRGSKGFRGGDQSYKIGYAISLNGIDWERKDKESGISCSDSGWDSKMIAYPEVFQLKKEVFMFYNGNFFGKEGFGYAKLSKNEE